MKKCITVQCVGENLGYFFTQERYSKLIWYLGKYRPLTFWELQHLKAEEILGFYYTQVGGLTGKCPIEWDDVYWIRENYPHSYEGLAKEYIKWHELDDRRDYDELVQLSRLEYLYLELKWCEMREDLIKKMFDKKD